MGVITPGVTPSDAWANSSTKPLSVAESSSRPVSGHPSLPFRDEEALFWPQYPLDELLMEQGYCAEFLSENPNPPFAAKSEGGGGGGGSEPPADDYNYSSGGIARYSPLLPPASVDPYGKARALVRERSTPPPFDHPAWPHRGGGGVHNFSLFSSPVAEARASLQNMATLNKGMLGKKEVGGGRGEPLGNTTREASAGSPLPTTQPWFGSRKSSNRPAVEADSSKGKKPQRDNRTNSTVTGSAVTATDGETEAFEAQEQTRTRTRTQTRSRDSTDESTEESGKEAASSLKRKKSQGDESEYQSEDLEDAATLTVKPSTGRTKRRRAAEIHNESERRRRDRINEKMKALQALVPNANKTDKASMLDEAIEYLKLLQAQVQMMSMRTGMSMPPMMMTMGMPHLHHPQQVPPLTQMGVGMGMGMMDASSGHGMVPTLANPVQPFRGPGYPVNIFRPAMPMNTNECQYYLQTPGAVEPYGAFVASQQFQSANANMHMYNAVLQQQHMLQLQNNHIQAQQSVGNNPGNASTKEGP